jgi:hypothetical protein
LKNPASFYECILPLGGSDVYQVFEQFSEFAVIGYSGKFKMKLLPCSRVIEEEVNTWEGDYP